MEKSSTNAGLNLSQRALQFAGRAPHDRYASLLQRSKSRHVATACTLGIGEHHGHAGDTTLRRSTHRCSHITTARRHERHQPPAGLQTGDPLSQRPDAVIFLVQAGEVFHDA